MENTELQKQQNNDSGSGDGSTNSKEDKISRSKNGSPRRYSTSFANTRNDTSPRDINHKTNNHNCLINFICLLNPLSYYFKYRARIEERKLRSSENDDLEIGNDNYDTRNKASSSTQLSSTKSSIEQTSYTSNGLSSSTLKKKNAKQYVNNQHNDNVIPSSDKIVEKTDAHNAFTNTLEQEQQQQQYNQQRDSMRESKKMRTKLSEKSIQEEINSNDELFSGNARRDSMSIQIDNFTMDDTSSKHETLAEANARIKREKEEIQKQQQLKNNGKIRKSNTTSNSTKDNDNEEQSDSSFHNLSSTLSSTFNENADKNVVLTKKKKKNTASKKSEELEITSNNNNSSLVNENYSSSISQYNRDNSFLRESSNEDDVVFNNETLVL